MPLFSAPSTASAASSNSSGTAAIGHRNFTVLGAKAESSLPSEHTLPATTGRTLGGTTRRGLADPRAARLQALDKKTDLSDV
jgi:hypothetical protein